jgi:hypothetical protein
LIQSGGKLKGELALEMRNHDANRVNSIVVSIYSAISITSSFLSVEGSEGVDFNTIDVHLEEFIVPSINSVEIEGDKELLVVDSRIVLFDSGSGVTKYIKTSEKGLVSTDRGELPKVTASDCPVDNISVCKPLSVEFSGD